MQNLGQIVRCANDEIEALQQDIANLIAAGEQAMRALIELDGGDPTNETGWDDELALQAWRALTVAIAIAKGRGTIP